MEVELWFILLMKSTNFPYRKNFFFINMSNERIEKFVVTREQKLEILENAKLRK